MKITHARLQAELFRDGASLGSILTDGVDQLVIGSSRKADLILPESCKNAQIHALLRLTAKKEILLFDLGSESGTFVGGKRVIEKQLGTGDRFAIGEHEVKVRLLETPKEHDPFWKSTCNSNERLTIRVLEQGYLTQEFLLQQKQKLLVGSNPQSIFFPGLKKNATFLRWIDKELSLEAIIPEHCVAHVYNGENTLLRVGEINSIPFHPGEKLRLLSKNGSHEIQLYWSTLEKPVGRSSTDEDHNVLRKSFAGAISILATILLFMLYQQSEKTNTEPNFPRSTYYRLSTEGAAPAQMASPQATEMSAKPSEASKITDTLKKLLHKPQLNISNLKTIVAKSGNQSTRASIARKIQTQEMDTGNLANLSAEKLNAIKSDLSTSGGKGSGKLQAFSEGSLKLGESGNGKGFDMRVDDEEAEAMGGLDKSLISNVVQANLGQIKHCYEKQLLLDQKISGKIVAIWTIAKDGTVSASSIKKTTMNSAAVENCIVGKIKGWEFPKPKGGGVVQVSYPFLFKPLN